jgi:hypothetical protein
VVLELCEALESDEITKPCRVYLPPASADLFKGVPRVTVVKCTRLEDAVFHTWPELRQGVRV